ncbi:membrane-targeted effector domain-containing toxin [Pseudomonas maumuensis]|uniref:Membrane-targeted effector domain-containing toxin n=2 Tax=Pseudomonas maumuensis TaxID=2842354 RepID=A0ABX8NTH6_9PSED|nr:membrane-targeted effector domain-containing toxin [Pseudomonas maumuensis]
MSMIPLDDQQTLQQLARDLVQTCPDMRQRAREVALEILHKHRLYKLDPDNVYLHRFATAHSAATFTGWAHNQQPVQSMTLPQLVMQRFNAQDADNADLLGYLSGFYQEGPGADSYDAHNEVALSPQEVLNYFWEIDFCSDFKARIHSFWGSHSDAFRTLAKANFLSKVLEVRHQTPDSALAKCCGEIADALLGGAIWPPTVAQLQEEVSTPEGMRFCTFDIGGYVATDILRIVMSDGRQLLYTPGAVTALHLFADTTELFWWVLINNNYDENRTRFSSHFALKDRGERNDLVGLDHLTDLLYQQWGKQDFAGLNVLDQTVTADPFTWLRDKTHQRMLDDADHALHSNAELRKQLWLGYLGAFNQVFGPLAALDWPIALVTVGAGLAETGLNIDQAVHARTTAERKQAIIGAIVAAITTLFNATFLLDSPGKALAEAGAASEPATLDPQSPPAQEGTGETVTPDEATVPEQSPEEHMQNWVPKPFWPSEATQMLEPFESNVILTGEPGTGKSAGVYLQNGKFYVQIDSLPYQVRFVQELQSWVVIDPENPYSFYGCHIIRLDAEGQWQLAPRPKGHGGAPGWLKIWGRSAEGKPLAPLPASPYEIPQAIRPNLEGASDGLLSGRSYDPFNPMRESACQEFRTRRDQLAADATEFFKTPTLPERPQVPELTASASPKELIQKVFENADGLVLGESHHGIASKRFLIDNAELLRKQKVQVLYMEHYMTDFQQADLDTFNQTGRMPEALDQYVTNQDYGHLTDPLKRYTFRRVMQAAQKNGIRIQSIDCMASYQQAWLERPKGPIRQKMMNFYAHTVIEADQTLRGANRWVALVGNSHSDYFLGIAGVGDLEGALTLRCEDVPVGQPDTIDLDPGMEVTDKKAGTVTLKSDLRLRAAVSNEPPPSPNTPLKPPALRSLEQRLRTPGDYSIETSDGQSVLVNRGRDNTLRRTPIHQEGSFIYIERSDWPWINKRHLPDLTDLHTRLKLHGLRPVPN